MKPHFVSLLLVMFAFACAPDENLYLVPSDPDLEIIPGASSAEGINDEIFNLLNLDYPGLETVKVLFEAGDTIRGHEFHHWDAAMPGEALTARKPSGRSWQCAYTSDTLYAGYPHLYFMNNPKSAQRFIQACHERKIRHEANGH